MRCNMDKETKDRWLADLRSGEYKQCKGTLSNGEGYCCLGVLAYHNLYKYKLDSKGCLSCGPYDVLSEDETNALIYMNDTKSLSFEKIADWIEENIRTVD